jgi:hypothetical protein
MADLRVNYQLLALIDRTLHGLMSRRVPTSSGDGPTPGCYDNSALVGMPELPG